MLTTSTAEEAEEETGTETDGTIIRPTVVVVRIIPTIINIHHRERVRVQHRHRIISSKDLDRRHTIIRTRTRTP